jgi:VWFA-related protein
VPVRRFFAVPLQSGWESMTHVARAGGVLASVALAAAVVAAAPQDPAGQSQVTPRFRAGIDVISVDVQVVDSEGHPAPGLTAEDFEVTIGGRRRRVVSADFIGGPPSAREATTPETPEAVSSSLSAAAGAEAPRGDGAARHIYVLAIDTSSFDQATARPVILAASDFLKQLRPQDEVGVFAYPNGPKLDPTTDHDAVVRSLETVQAIRETPPPGLFNLAPSHIVELSRAPQTQLALQLTDAYCPPAADNGCRDLLLSQVRSDVLFYEGVATAGGATLHGLMKALGEVPDRKTVVLISGGVVAADFVGARPDAGGAFRELGRAAAQSNVNVFTLFVDQSRAQTISAESRTMPVPPDVVRERELAARVLAEVSDASGGVLLTVAAGNGSTAFARVARESSSYYLLGIEATPEDRGARPRELRIRVRDRRLNVRGRNWIGVPRFAGSEPADAATSRPPVPPPSLPPATADLKQLATMYDQDDQAGLVRALAPSNASRLLRAFREHESPWPASPRRTAALALDLALLGIAAESPYTKEEALRLLGEHIVRVRAASEGDAFECLWLEVATAGTAGHFAPELGTLVAERAVERCPENPRLQLARAVAHDQQLVRVQRQFGPVMLRPEEEADLERHVITLYERAATLSETRFEAHVRLAQLHLRAKRHDEGLAALASAGNAPPDPVLFYYANLISGQLLAASGNHEQAERALRTALDVAPAAQSARVALMSVLIARGQPEPAARLADDVLAAAPGTIVDPWWGYHLGTFRDYSTLRAQLREAVEP